MKANITFEITAEEVAALLDKLREHRKADEKEWEERHPHPIMGEPIMGTTEPIFRNKKDKPN